MPMTAVADRFIETPGGRVIDLATGADVVLTISSAGGPTDQLRWAARCDWFQQLFQPSLARLLDYGLIGETRRFEAWQCCLSQSGAPSKEASRTACSAAAFLRACGLTASENGEAMGVANTATGRGDGDAPGRDSRRRGWLSLRGAGVAGPRVSARQLRNRLRRASGGWGGGGALRSSRRGAVAAPGSVPVGTRGLRKDNRIARAGQDRAPERLRADQRAARGIAPWRSLHGPRRVPHRRRRLIVAPRTARGGDRIAAGARRRVHRVRRRARHAGRRVGSAGGGHAGGGSPAGTPGLRRSRSQGGRAR